MYRMVCGILEVLDSCFTLATEATEIRQNQRSQAVSLASHLLTLPTAPCVERHVKSVLAALHPSRQSYHNYKVC